MRARLDAEAEDSGAGEARPKRRCSGELASSCRKRSTSRLWRERLWLLPAYDDAVERRGDTNAAAAGEAAAEAALAAKERTSGERVVKCEAVRF